MERRRSESPPTTGRTTLSPSTHEPSLLPHATLTSSLGRSAAALEKDVGIQRSGAQSAGDGRRWQEQQAPRGHLPPRERRAAKKFLKVSKKNEESAGIDPKETLGAPGPSEHSRTGAWSPIPVLGAGEVTCPTASLISGSAVNSPSIEQNWWSISLPVPISSASDPEV